MGNLLKLSLLTAVLAGIIYFLRATTGDQIVHPHINWYLLGTYVLAVITSIIGDLAKKDPSKAYTYFIGGSMFRLMFSLALFATYLIMYKQEKGAILVAAFNFVFLYIVYATMEVISFLSNLRRS